MLRALRKSMKAILWATIVVVVASFIFYGSRRGSKPPQEKIIGELYGKKITAGHYYSSLRWVRMMAQLQYGTKYEEVEKFLNLNSQALDNILLLESAQRRGIKVSDAELRGYIAQFPLFHNRDGKFDSALYNQVLQNYLGMHPEFFEAGVRDLLKIRRLRETLTASAKLSEREIQRYTRYINEKLKVKFILFQLSDYEKEIKVSDEKLQEYFSSHRKEFQVPQRARVSYILLRKEPEDVNVEEAQIKNFYEQNKDLFKDPQHGDKLLPLENVKKEINDRLRREKAKEKAKEKAENILSNLEHGVSNWKDLNPIETPFFSEDSRVADLPDICVQRAFAMRPGEISNVIESEDAFFIMKLKDRVEAKEAHDFKDVYEQLREKITRVEAAKLTESKANKCLDQIKAGGSIEKAAKEYSKKVTETEFFSRLGYIKEIGFAPDFIKKAFKLTKSRPLDVASVPQGFCALMFAERKLDEEKLEEDEKQKLEAILLDEKREMTFADYFFLLKEEAGADFSSITQKNL